MLEDQTELLIGSVIAHEILDRHKSAKEEGILETKPVISIVIEEAPRVLGDEVLRSSGSNIYSDIAREGRKFKIGLIAITQLTSVIPKTILANMNTKIILGNELATERSSIIQSASQDLSTDDRNIASLDKGEAIISSNFTKFAVPMKIPLFEDIVKDMKASPTKKIAVVT
jgi:DNA helicase HerA-like ATPase